MKEVLGIKLYTYDEVAEMLGVHPTSITRYTKEGRINATTIGKTKYIPEQEIKNFVLGKGNQAESKQEQA